LEQGTIHRVLTEKVRRILRDARIVLTSLPQIPSIRLCLLSQDYPQACIRIIRVARTRHIC